MKELSAGKLKVKNSIFFGHLYHISKEDDIDLILNYHKNLYKKANHHCYALIFSNNDNTYTYYKNDGEVGRPGQLLLELLIKYKLNNVLLCVSRIFGGIKLGVGGVSRAFKKVGESVIEYYISKNISK